MQCGGNFHRKRSPHRKVGVRRRRACADGWSTAGWCVLTPFVCRANWRASKCGDDVHAESAGGDRARARSASRRRALYFARCGGCHYQHAPYEFQLARKVEILREQLRRVGQDRLSGRDRDDQRRAARAIAIGRSFISRTARIGYLAARSHRSGAGDRRLPDLVAAAESGAGADSRAAARSEVPAIRALARSVHE